MQYLPEKGTIKLSQARDQWNDGKARNAISGKISLASQQVRDMAGVPTGAIKMSDLYAKHRGWRMQFMSIPFQFKRSISPPSHGWGGGQSEASIQGVGFKVRQATDFIGYPIGFYLNTTFDMTTGTISPTNGKVGDVTLMAIYSIPSWKSTLVTVSYDSGDSGTTHDSKRYKGDPRTVVFVRIEGNYVQTDKRYTGRDMVDEKADNGEGTSFTKNTYPNKLQITFRRTNSGDKNHPVTIGNFKDSPVIFSKVTTPYAVYRLGSWWSIAGVRGAIGCISYGQAGQPGNVDDIYGCFYRANTRLFSRVGESYEIADIWYW